MNSIVLELQQDALNKNVHLADLLRKALVVARKLKVTAFERWLDLELSGYENSKDLPAYRQLKGSVRIVNPFMGLQPVFFGDTKVGEQLSSRPIGMSVAAMEALLSKHEPGGTLTMPFNPGIEKALMKGMDCDMQPLLVLDHSQIVSVLDCIRNVVLKWALQLEEEGIIGEGLTFGTKEKTAATSPSITNINNYFQNISNSQIQQDSSNSSQNLNLNKSSSEQLLSLISAISEIMPSFAIENSLKEELRAEVATIKAQIDSPKPKDGIVKQSLGSIKSILEKAGGSAAGQLLIELGKIVF